MGQKLVDLEFKIGCRHLMNMQNNADNKIFVCKLKKKDLGGFFLSYCFVNLVQIEVKMFSFSIHYVKSNFRHPESKLHNSG